MAYTGRRNIRSKSFIASLCFTILSLAAFVFILVFQRRYHGVYSCAAFYLLALGSAAFFILNFVGRKKRPALPVAQLALLILCLTLFFVFLPEYTHEEAYDILRQEDVIIKESGYSFLMSDSDNPFVSAGYSFLYYEDENATGEVLFVPTTGKYFFYPFE